MMEKKQITPKVRNHVVREVAARMLDHCLYPTNNQYQVVAAKIIGQFPVLADTLIGTGYVSNFIIMLLYAYVIIRMHNKLHIFIL